MAGCIGDHAIIGDCRSAALVSGDGSVDWLCWPGFESPSVMGGLLDAKRGGSWRVAPLFPCASSRAYAGQSAVLVTRHEGRDCAVTVTDFMAVAGEEEKRRLFQPDHELVRIIACERGEGEMEVSFAPRPCYGEPAVIGTRPFGLRCALPQGLLTLMSDIPFHVSGGSAAAALRVRKGDRLASSLTFNTQAPAAIPPPRSAEAALTRSIGWWERWTERCTYEGAYGDAVIRSAITLKLMGFSPSGTFIASPTTSLPEDPGGGLNWDYRYCWLRDSSLTVRALASLGYREEAMAYLSWLLHSTRLTLPRLGVLYDVYGRRPAKERELRLAGYAGSRPVRAGNAAMDQLQLDVYGEVADAAHFMLAGARRLDHETAGMLAGLGDFVCGHWREKESGIWEARGRKTFHTHSLAMCWVCLDRLCALNRTGLLPGIPVGRFRREKNAIRRLVMENGWDERLGSFSATIGGDDLDASLLLLPLYGFIDASDLRMRGTFRRLRERLGAGEGLLYRNSDYPEGAFAACSCWAADYLARGGGSLREARGFFERFLGYANDVGLFGEEIDPGTGGPLGNFPLAFTHLGVITAALSIGRREGEAS